MKAKTPHRVKTSRKVRKLAAAAAVDAQLPWSVRHTVVEAVCARIGAKRIGKRQRSQVDEIIRQEVAAARVRHRLSVAAATEGR